MSIELPGSPYFLAALPHWRRRKVEAQEAVEAEAKLRRLSAQLAEAEAELAEAEARWLPAGRPHSDRCW